MAKDFDRSRRVAEQLQRELSQLVHFEVKDPRVDHLLTISDIEVSRDLAYARVYVSHLDPAHDMAAAVKALNHAAGFLRREIAHRMSLRIAPQIKFYFDETLDRGNRISALIHQAVAADRTVSDNPTDIAATGAEDDGT
ncbi:MAG: 30S ribosome-binding factor RbfA [Gammaproteobacteria bacterium]|nr:30S ribosome-binding factor RbfA [Gammaproteobacteria bacterium]